MSDVLGRKKKIDTNTLAEYLVTTNSKVGLMHMQAKECQPVPGTTQNTRKNKMACPLESSGGAWPW